jgi:NCAIR mutase (PurE)-related protein
MTAQRILASALGALGAVSAVPLALAQLDFAGVVNAFDIHAGDAPHAVLVFAGVSGALTCLVAIAGLVRATILWIPTGLAIGAAAVLLSVEQTASPRAG